MHPPIEHRRPVSGCCEGFDPESVGPHVAPRSHARQRLQSYRVSSAIKRLLRVASSVPSGGDEDPTKLGGCKGWMIMWPKTLIRAETAGATPIQGNTTLTPPIQLPSFGLGDHSGCEEGPTVPVADHAAPVDPLDNEI